MKRSTAYFKVNENIRIMKYLFKQFADTNNDVKRQNYLKDIKELVSDCIYLIDCIGDR